MGRPASPGVDDPGNLVAAPRRATQRHFRHIDPNRRGCMLIDATRERVVCEWRYVATVQVPSPLQTFGRGTGRAHDRKHPEQLCRYITRPALSYERVQLNAGGQVELKLKTQCREGTTHLVMNPLEFMQRLAALVPLPR